ncbi:hypothetical protein GobsT_16760 [Gemmata obscuriglobus]|uniref:Uncharacterized protein n=1 Tax=Gemmata obscuriglobus TaxID=114 RepID=A0A2Z3HF37_9BACT|nr:MULTISPECIES: hypothetical protein [Gemmata]AWM39930.1 hypothetical protein C1280_24950 [Gemmata obscuriglobus]MDY3554531.1 hypothetical protein [Gemmata algarum]QEG26928.1 hypothetical protein GobsT_16760 [Gemmata obscuriglobus]VTS03074.1 unnamed protein product [Gemmata obscuriglobus UQM 2246]
MNHELDVLTLLLLDPCLTADEAAREAAARRSAVLAAEPRDEMRSRRGRKVRAATVPAEDGPAMGF